MQIKNNCNCIHKLYLTRFLENDIKIIKDYVQTTVGFTFHNSVKFTIGDNNDLSGNISNNKEKNKKKYSEISN